MCVCKVNCIKVCVRGTLCMCENIQVWIAVLGFRTLALWEKNKPKRKKKKKIKHIFFSSSSKSIWFSTINGLNLFACQKLPVLPAIELKSFFGLNRFSCFHLDRSKCKVIVTFCDASLAHCKMAKLKTIFSQTMWGYVHSYLYTLWSVHRIIILWFRSKFDSP